MPVEELMGARVEIGPHRLRVANPIVDRVLPGAAHLVAERNCAVLSVRGVGTFAVTEGSRVCLQPQPNADPGVIAAWLQGTVAALLLAQRGRFALHASVNEVDGRAVAVAGQRSVGKSTTALRLVQRGHRLIADDVSPVEAEGPIIVRPYARPVHVAAGTAESLRLDLSQAWRPFTGHPKLALPAPVRTVVQLAAVVVLRAGTDDAVTAERVRGARAHWDIATNIYRIELLEPLWREELFELASAISTNVPVWALTRPAGGWTVDEVADAVERIAGPRRGER